MLVSMLYCHLQVPMDLQIIAKPRGRFQQRLSPGASASGIQHWDTRYGGANGWDVSKADRGYPEALDMKTLHVGVPKVFEIWVLKRQGFPLEVQLQPSCSRQIRVSPVANGANGALIAPWRPGLKFVKSQQVLIRFWEPVDLRFWIRLASIWEFQ